MMWREPLIERYVELLRRQALTTSQAEEVTAAAACDDVWRQLSDGEQTEAERRWLATRRCKPRKFKVVHERGELVLVMDQPFETFAEVVCAALRLIHETHPDGSVISIQDAGKVGGSA